ncbi:MAG TPA: hydantoinase/oxoprolinase family protein [Deltaproteobacteria bacterium]|nr:hydantoinase/oxoprolinase family protein [Deltaproteobacteria bacterium]
MILGIDVGGTHTDAVCIDGGAVRATAKTLTVGDLVHSIREVIRALDIDCRKVERTILSTTLSTNAIIEKTFAPAGMIISAGPGIDPRNYFLTDDFHLVSGAIDHRGREYIPIRPDEIRGVSSKLKAKGVSGVGIVSKFSARNPAHEQGIHSLIKGDFEHVSMGHTLSGSLNFPRRIHTTFFNTSVMPVQKRFMLSVRQALAELGIESQLLFLKADGGTYPASATELYPVETILSGPAASMMGGLALSTDPGITTLVMDIGGTTTDIGILIQGVPILEPKGVSIDGLKTLVRGLKVVSVGAGGDSCVSLVGGELRVGPHREGPPVCLGGPMPTPMDALAVLGSFPSGNIDKARSAIAPIAGVLGVGIEDVSRQIVSALVRNMRDKAREFIDEVNRYPVYTIYEMLHPELVEPRQVLAIGGPAAQLRPFLEDAFGMKCVVPGHAMVANALGAALARTTTQITMVADTQLGRMVCPEMGIDEKVGSSLTMEDLKKQGKGILTEHLALQGITGNLEISILEEQTFNIVRGFSSAGRNFRLKLQTKPGILDQWSVTC